MVSSGASLARLGVLAGLFGSSYLLIKIALGSFSPEQITLIRLLLGSLVLLAVCAVRRLRLPREPRLWLLIAGAALLANVLPFLLFATAGRSVDTSVSGMLNATTPLWALGVAVLLGTRRRLTVWNLAGVALGFGGVVLLLAPWQRGEVDVGGALLCLAASASYAAAYVYVDRFLGGRGLPLLTRTAAQLLAGTGLALCAVPFTGFPPIEPALGPVLALTVLGVLGTGFAFVLNNRLIAEEGGAATSTVGYLVPVVSVLLGVLLLGESLAGFQWIGMVVVLLGVGLTRHQGRDERPAGETSEAAPAPENQPTPETRPALIEGKGDAAVVEIPDAVVDAWQPDRQVTTPEAACGARQD